LILASEQISWDRRADEMLQPAIDLARIDLSGDLHAVNRPQSLPVQESCRSATPGAYVRQTFDFRTTAATIAFGGGARATPKVSLVLKLVDLRTQACGATMEV
jgi:hypothetical protein